MNNRNSKSLVERICHLHFYEMYQLLVKLRAKCIANPPSKGYFKVEFLRNVFFAFEDKHEHRKNCVIFEYDL